MEEIWKDIKGFEGIYQVSNLGKVKSLNYNHTKKEKLLILGITRYNYKTISLCYNNIKKSYAVHQLVAIAFLNHTPSGFDFVVNHKDFDRQNNNINNLEIVTHRENTNRKHLKSTSKYVGVSWHKRIEKWQSRIVVKNKTIHLGYFINEIEASVAYQKALSKILSS